MSTRKSRGAETQRVAAECKRCGSPRPAGRPSYCGDQCAGIARHEHRRRQQERRMAACQRCAGPKQLGTRGGRFCDECRRIVADASEQFQYELRRRRWLERVAERAESGERIAKRWIDAPDGHKWCARCQDFRPITSFPPRKDTGKQASYCRPCQRSYNRERRVKIEFGLTWDEYELLMACQDFRCAICGGKPRKHALSIDHDHKTGEIRGLLCGRCNHRLLGAANDDPARLRKAADYLEAYGPRDVFGEPKYIPGSEPQDGAA